MIVIQAEFTIVSNRGVILARGTLGADGDSFEHALRAINQSLIKDVISTLSDDVKPTSVEIVPARIIFAPDQSPLIKPVSKIVTN